MTQSIVYLPPPFAMRSAKAAEAWERSLPIPAQLALQKAAYPWIQKQPPAVRLQMARYLISNGIAVPAELHVDGLGQVASLLTGFAQLAAQLYMAKQANKLSSQETSQTNATQQQIATINNQAAVAAAAITSGATVDAAKQAAGADVAIAKVKGTTSVTNMPTIMKWGAVAAVGLGTVAILIWMMKGKAAPTAPAAA